MKFGHFEEFADAKPLEGLGCGVAMIRRLIADDGAARTALTLTLNGRQGERTDLLDNIQDVEPAPTGTSTEAALRRLNKDRPDLLARVTSNEMSPHAAMVEAGFRKRTIQIPADPAGAARRLLRHFRGEDRSEQIRLLTAE